MLLHKWPNTLKFIQSMNIVVRYAINLEAIQTWGQRPRAQKFHRAHNSLAGNKLVGLHTMAKGIDSKALKMPTWQHFLRFLVNLAYKP